MMNKNRKWLLALSVAGLITANGIAMAAVTSQQEEGTGGQRPAFTEKMRHDGMKKHKEEIKPLLALLHIDEATFKTEMQAGKTLLDIADEHGVSEQTLKDFIKQHMTQRLDQAVESGKITQDKADKMKANMDERISKMINAKAPMHEGKMPKHGMFNNAELLAMLHVDADTLKAEMQSGKTLVNIASEHGVSEQALKDFIKQQMTQRIDQAVEAGKISQDKADKMKANMDERIARMINAQAPMHDGKKMAHKGLNPEDQK